jgi:4-hydroxythreonine-4-phosphate dehydrogenase
LTLGDPAGIGPEVVLKALADQTVTQGCEVAVLGCLSWLEQAYQKLKGCQQSLADPAGLNLIEPAHFFDCSIQPGQPSPFTGEASFADLQQAIALTLSGQFQGIVTGPIAKSAWQQAGHLYPGQTELLAEMAGVQRFGMLFVAESPHTGWMLRTLLATTHIPLHQVATTLTPALMSQKLELLIESLRSDFGLDQPRIAIAGLNPHSGEQGQLGTEEQTWLIPWLEEQRSRYPDLTLMGPVPPDTLWVQPGQAWFGNYPAASTPSAPLNTADAYLALYHDQGLIPVKLMGFDRAVNTTIGLPFIRTSPDHGTAFDIAGQGIADPTSMKAAIRLAAFLVRQRTAAPAR